MIARAARGPVDVGRALRQCEILEEEDRELDVPLSGILPEAAAAVDPEPLEITERHLRDLGGLHDRMRASDPTSNARPTLPYQRLAHWLAAARGGHTAGARYTAAEVAACLTAKLDVDLASSEPWISDFASRAYTRGALERHCGGQGGRNRFRRGGAAVDRLLNRFLLEDAFPQDIDRVDECRLRALRKRVLAKNRAAVCFSGGGIRSATFGLGVLQGLAAYGLLTRFHYISTVSGGGYLGGWLSAWSTHAGFDKVVKHLDCNGAGASLEPEAAPVAHLRAYSNYLSPKLGVFSADTWTLIATYLRNLLLEWLVAVPLLGAVAIIPWLCVACVQIAPPTNGMGWIWLTALTAVGLVNAATAVQFIHSHRPETDSTPADTNRARGDQGQFLQWCLLPLVIATITLTLAWYWFEHWELTSPPWVEGLHRSLGIDDPVPTMHFLSVGGLIFAAGGALTHLVGWLFSRTRPHPQKTGWRHSVEWLAIIITGAIAGWLALGAAWLLHSHSISETSGLAATINRAETFIVFALPGFLGVILVAGFAFEGVTSLITEDAEREWNARYSGWIAIVLVAWLGFGALILFGPRLTQHVGALWPYLATFVTSGGVTAKLGRSAKTSAGTSKSGNVPPSGWKATVARFALPLVSAIAVASCVVVVSWLDVVVIKGAWKLLHPGVDTPFDVLEAAGSAPFHVTLFVFFALLAAGLSLGLFIDTNRLSLHGMYRARLIRGYLGASRPAGERRPNPFTGFDEKDNVQMGCLRVPTVESQSVPPFHVVNMALNLVTGEQLARQERKAESFTVTPLHAGSGEVGYRRTRIPGVRPCPPAAADDRFYGGKRAISLGTAVTISGAAASPNMGYHSSPAVTFLMTLFNARLGWWLGNPGPIGQDVFHRSAPRQAVRPLIDEMFGRTTDTNEYVYLSDGGHFENLGLYEMVMRRCRTIIVCDASCDEECALADLGAAIRRIRVDFGIPIEFSSTFPIKRRSADGSVADGRAWAYGRIRYSCVDMPQPLPEGETADDYDGVIVYIKPGLYGGEPRDVYNYAVANAAFPHESTADQFFSESQFESYRALGRHIMASLAADWDKTGYKLTDVLDAPWRHRFLSNFA